MMIASTGFRCSPHANRVTSQSKNVRNVCVITRRSPLPNAAAPIRSIFSSSVGGIKLSGSRFTKPKDILPGRRVGAWACKSSTPTLNSIERAVGRHAANQFLETMDSNVIDTPTISVSENANIADWQWSYGIDNKPKYSMQALSETFGTQRKGVSGSSAAGGRSGEHTVRDAFSLVERDIEHLSGSIKELIGSDHPVLESCAKYFFNMDGGKKIRPTMVLAISYALNAQHQQEQEQRQNADPNTLKNSEESRDLDNLYATPAQKRLAEITEMIHTASLFHDDVIDKATTRRNQSAVNQVFGNKLAILGGDFLLSRASVSLARLRNLEVVELLSTVIEHLVKGEIMQMKPTPPPGNIEIKMMGNFSTSSGASNTNTAAVAGGDSSGESTQTLGEGRHSILGETEMPLSDDVRAALEYYLRKNYYKTASLMGHSCLAAAVLGNQCEKSKRASYLYGTYVGIAFQLIDDALDFEGTTLSLGKAPLADLKSGLATAPTLFAAEEFPQLLSLIGRKFDLPGDVDEALSLVQRSKGIDRCRRLAQVHAEKAIEAIQQLQPSAAREALIALACKVVVRTY